MKIAQGLRRRHLPGLRASMDVVLVVAGIAGLLLVNGLACYHLGKVMSDVSASVALLAAIGR